MCRFYVAALEVQKAARRRRKRNEREEIRQLRDAQYRFARLAFDKWQMERMEVQPLIDNTL